MGITALATATHVAEAAEDDIAFLEIQDEIERRPSAEQEAYRMEWMRQIRERGEADAE